MSVQLSPIIIKSTSVSKKNLKNNSVTTISINEKKSYKAKIPGIFFIKKAFIEVKQLNIKNVIGDFTNIVGLIFF